MAFGSPGLAETVRDVDGLITERRGLGMRRLAVGEGFMEDIRVGKNGGGNGYSLATG